MPPVTGGINHKYIVVEKRKQKTVFQNKERCHER